MGGRRLCWMKWRRVCLPKSNGGLGVRNIKLVNLSLLAKWRWRLINEDGALWKRVLEDKYGEGVGMLGEGGGVSWPLYASNWWKDVTNLEGKEGVPWLKMEVIRKLGNGMGTRFWKEKWLAEGILGDLFPRLFAISNQHNIKVGEVWNRSGEEGSGRLTWRRDLFV